MAWVNDGFLWAALALTVAGVISITSGWRMHVDEKQALVAAQRAVGFPVGHASAQQVWRGLRSRPTWRVLCYSAEDPPHARGLVLVDAVDGTVVEALVEDNPERWSAAPLRWLERSAPDPVGAVVAIRLRRGAGGGGSPHAGGTRAACWPPPDSWARRSRSSNSTERSERVFERTQRASKPRQFQPRSSGAPASQPSRPG